MITIAFWEGNTYTEKEYTGETCAVLASLDMAEHITKGGWCSADYGNTSIMVTNLRQLGFK